MSLYRDEGVVLRTMRLGEADRIVTILCKAHGKVRAVAKGVRKTSSKFGGRLEPLNHVALQCWSGRGELDTITQVEGIENFKKVREDLGRVGKGFAMVEVADRLSEEQHEDPELYELLVRALRELERDDSPLVLPAYLLKVLTHEGSAPMLDACVSCGSTDDDLVAFDPSEGGALCRNCRRGRPLTNEALVLMRAILGGQLAAALRQPSSTATSEVAERATEAMEWHLDRRLRSVRVGFGHDPGVDA